MGPSLRGSDVDPFQIAIVGACSGLCCLSATALGVGGAILFLRRKPSEFDDLASSPELARRLGTAGAADVRERFALETMTDTIDALYRSLLERP